jgi:2-polyprenyl-3-methyl-5-hydroxy-6-metoxy-1,4-benzoquinol methylase
MNPANLKYAYPGRELEAMSEAVNYHRWIFDMFRPYLGRRLVEVGAGNGSFSELIALNHSCDVLLLVEPSELMYQNLKTLAGKLKMGGHLEALHGRFTELAGAIRSRTIPDSIIYVNVLEHIKDDEAELETVLETLAPSGRMLIFVPALACLYGRFDQVVGHFRRYRKAELELKLRTTGFRILFSKYVDFPGVIPWLVKYRLFRSGSMEATAVRFYDRYAIPIIRQCESRLAPPIGKNIIVVAEKI